ncbi:helix-turn-helix domain-containing protein [Sphingobacterium daejeonense]|uniref:helix-turn-helix domain-containing protein n=1 Tax=Sphingobacterium daejeonense TaxID=371142 RepID=UPI0021A89FB3|nr:helix-turn-helix domain-containing protein [Sphingobacterium daejeonense]MCT1530522.1 helix-turn-helix domain-containing protein [Sphingobacterium daejeonense]
MDDILKIKTVSEHDAFYHKENLHPMVSVIDFDGRVPEIYASKMVFDFYIVYLKDVVCGDLKYGKQQYDYQDRTLVFVAPGQVIHVDINTDYKPQGFALAFHPDFLHGTSLGKIIHDYSFFFYESNEALHISQKERKIVLDSFEKILFELNQGLDKHSKMLIIENIQLFLNYCNRFYDRQFITRNQVNKDVLISFENYLNFYFQSDQPKTKGLPTVGYFAEKLHLSTNYFGDLIKKETGKTVLQFIHLKMIDIAKDLILENKKTINEIAYHLGFRYPAHFTRTFKKNTGLSPIEYRIENSI